MEGRNGRTLYVIGLDPGITTGWAAIGIPADSIYGTEKGYIVHWTFGQIDGPESGQALAICGIIKGISRLATKPWDIGTIIESFTVKRMGQEFSFLSPVRIGAKIELAMQLGRAGEVNHPVFQDPVMAMTTATDKRLKAWSLYSPGKEHARDATRHAITAIRRAKKSDDLRARLWGGLTEAQ
jgi:hypothetical protein